MINKIAVGEIEKADSSLLKTWCKKEKRHEILNQTYDVDRLDGLNTTEFATDVPVVTEVNEVNVERCKFVPA